jgi:hypothetical protein
MQTLSVVQNWAQFDRQIRSRDRNLLACLADFPDPVLVAGCQRSGTTIVTRILREALEMPPLDITKDDELDAALILCGAAGFSTESRCCFQTTYLNDHLREYFDHDNYRLIWVIRRPEAVVRSMLLNWRRGALKRLFRACGKHALDNKRLARLNRYGTIGFKRLEMACLSYNVKTAQVHELAASLGPDRLHLVDYDDLIDKSEVLLPEIFSFASIPDSDSFLDRLQKPNRPRGGQLGESARNKIVETCDAEYKRAIELLKSRTQ